MKNLNLTTGEELTINELVNTIGESEDVINDSDIRTGEQTSVDNFDGEEGFNVSFKIIKKEERGFGVWSFVVKITGIDKL